MISVDVFLFGLLITSALTGLVTEALKKIFAEYNVKYRANTLAGVVAFILSAAIGTGYIILMNMEFGVQMVVCLIAQMFMSWLCAMVGYDKVIQTVSQLKTRSDEE